MISAESRVEDSAPVSDFMSNSTRGASARATFSQSRSSVPMKRSLIVSRISCVSRRRRSSSSTSSSSFHERQSHGHRRPFLYLARDLHLSFVCVDDPPHDRNAQARSPGVRAPGAVAAEEALEYEGNVRFGDPHAGVGDLDRRL